MIDAPAAVPAVERHALTIASPLGPLTLVGEQSALLGLFLRDDARARGVRSLDVAARGSVLADACDQLAAYFAGGRRVFDLRLAPHGTPFQHAVWAELARIPFGETRSYADVARAIGRPDAARAVGAANARNPLSIIVPCHRVIGSDGSCVGYAGGLAAKTWLLRHERGDVGRAADARTERDARAT